MRTITETDVDLSDAPIIVIPDERVELDWYVAPEEREMYAVWQECRRQWLNSIERKSGKRNSRRAYDRDVIQFFMFFSLQNLHEWQVNKIHAAMWVEGMAAEGLAPATINRKIAALSSFYRYASSDFVTTTGDGLWSHANPFSSRSIRYKVEPYERAVYPSTDDVAAILRQIDTKTLVGLRNLTIISGMFATARRVSEWLGLRWGDLHNSPTGYWFDYVYKGGLHRRQAIPGHVWELIQKYLVASGRWGTMAASDYVFIAHDGCAANLKTKDGAPLIPNYHLGEHPLSASYVNALLKRYGLSAGVDEALCHNHGLRHAGLRARKDDGADIFELQKTAGHKSIATTQIYTDAVLTTPTDDRGDRIVGHVMPKQLKFNV
jgi:site-specific recombinase XerD